MACDSSVSGYCRLCMISKLNLGAILESKAIL